MGRILFSAATCSWIDPATGLPEVDESPITQPSKQRSFFVGNNGYRFCNFMEVWIELSPNGRSISASGFTAASRMYRGPSYANIPSHAFDASRQTFAEADAVRFTQIVGARTVSPEVIGAAGGGIVGGALGGAVGGGLIGSGFFGLGAIPGAIIGGIGGAIVGAVAGDTVAHQVSAFPPIWTKIQIHVFRDGRAQAQLLQHSIFPSLTTYIQRESASAAPGANYDRVNHPNGQPYYNATKDAQLPDWKDHGWGALANTSAAGPTRGNPWGVSKGVTGGGENLPG